MPLTIAVTEFKPLRKNTLVGFATVRIAEMRLTIREIAIHEKNESRWAQLPARPWLKNNALVFDARGKVQYSPLLEWDNRDVADAFSARVIAALLEHTPSAFAPSTNAQDSG